MPAPPLSNTYEGGSDGTNITAGNSGGGSGDAFQTVTDTLSYLSYENSIARDTLSAKAAIGGTGATSLCMWTGLGSITTDLWWRMYLYFDNASVVNSNTIIMRGETAASSASFSIFALTTGKLRLTDSAAATVYTFSASYPLQSWFRIEAKVNTGTGAWEVWQYDTPDSETHTETSSGSGASLGANVDRARFGVGSTGLTNYTLHWDNVALATSGKIGPEGSDPPITDAPETLRIVRSNLRLV